MQARLIQETPVGHYRFTHALVQETLYDELSTASRTRVHAQIGEALEQIYAGDLEPHVTELAHHFAQAVPVTSVEKAVDYGVRAGSGRWRNWRGRKRSSTSTGRDSCPTCTSPETSRSLTDLLLALGAARIQAGAGGRRRPRCVVPSRVPEVDGPDRLAEAILLGHRGYRRQ